MKLYFFEGTSDEIKNIIKDRPLPKAYKDLPNYDEKIDRSELRSVVYEMLKDLPEEDVYDTLMYIKQLKMVRWERNKGNRKNPLTNFGFDVKKKLIDIDKPQSWLIEEIKKETNLYVDSSVLNKVLTGRLNSKKIIAAINKILFDS